MSKGQMNELTNEWVIEWMTKWDSYRNVNLNNWFVLEYDQMCFPTHHKEGYTFLIFGDLRNFQPNQETHNITIINYRYILPNLSLNAVYFTTGS